MTLAMQFLVILSLMASLASAKCASAGCQASGGISMLQARDSINRRVAQTEQAVNSESWINICYFTNWARYRTGLINKAKDVFEMGLNANLCSHFMYGFASVVPGAGNGGYELKSNDPNADHPSGHEAQDGLCPDECSDPNFKTNWSDPNGMSCDWPCNPSRVYRGYEGLTVGMKGKNPNIKALISVGGWNFNDCAASESATFGQGEKTCEIFSEIAADDDKIRKFAENVIAFCRKWGFDGFDLDWEYPVVAGHNDNTKVDGTFQETPRDYRNYIRMLEIMKQEFQKESPPLLLTAAVGVGKSTVDTAYDIKGMSEHLDLINLMTYDLHGAWEPRTGCNANLYATDEDTKLGGGVGAGEATTGYPLSVSWAVQYWINAGAPASKLTIGLATYGRGWTLSDPNNSGYNAPASGASSKGESTGEAGYKSYYEIQKILTKPDATAVYDEQRQCPYVVYNGEWISYDNKESICAKLAFAKGLGLAGSMVWALDLDDFDGQYSGGNSYPLISLMSDGGVSCGSLPGTTNPPSTQTTSTEMQTTSSVTTMAQTTKTRTDVQTTSSVSTQVQTTQKVTETTTVTEATTPKPSSSTSTSSSSTSSSSSSTSTGSSSDCVAAAAGFGATDAACAAACAVLPVGMWPCMDGGPCLCASRTTTTVQTTTPTVATTASQTTSQLPAGKCLAAWKECYDNGEYLDPCCEGLKCNVQSFDYGQCIPA